MTILNYNYFHSGEDGDKKLTIILDGPASCDQRVVLKKNWSIATIGKIREDPHDL